MGSWGRGLKSSEEGGTADVFVRSRWALLPRWEACEGRAGACTTWWRGYGPARSSARPSLVERASEAAGTGTIQSHRSPCQLRIVLACLSWAAWDWISWRTSRSATLVHSAQPEANPLPLRAGKFAVPSDPSTLLGPGGWIPFAKTIGSLVYNVRLSSPGQISL